VGPREKRVYGIKTVDPFSLKRIDAVYPRKNY